MARKQVGMIDADLLTRVDEHRAELGQTRRVYVERALHAALNAHDKPPASKGHRGSPSPSLKRFGGQK